MIHRVKSFIFEKANFKKMIDLKEKYELEDSMGFRGQWDEHRRFQIETLKLQGLRPEHRLLELGCGPLTAGIPVIEYLRPGHYIGVDIRSSVLDLGWREVGKAGLSGKNPRLICSNAFASDELRGERFDFVYSFSVLYHLGDDILDKYFETVSERLLLSGVCLANVSTHLPDDKWLEFPFLNRPVQTYVSMAQKHGLTTTNHGTLADLGFRSPATEKNNPLLSFRLRS